MAKKSKYQKERVTTNRQTMAVEGVMYHFFLLYPFVVRFKSIKSNHSP